MKHEVFMICPPWKQYRIYKRSPMFLIDNIPPKLLKALVAFRFMENCLNQLSSPDHVVFIWVTEKYTEECKDYMKHLGYEYHKYLIWHRPKWKRGSSKKVLEYLMVYYKGKMHAPVLPFPDSLETPFTGRVKDRERKPADAYAMIEAMFPIRPKLQIYGFTHRTGWNVFHHNN